MRTPSTEERSFSSGVVRVGPRASRTDCRPVRVYVGVYVGFYVFLGPGSGGGLPAPGGNRSLSERLWVAFARSPERLETGGVTRGRPIRLAGGGCRSSPGSGGGVGLRFDCGALASRSASERACVVLARSPSRLEMGGVTRGAPPSGVTAEVRISAFGAGGDGGENGAGAESSGEATDIGALPLASWTSTMAGAGRARGTVPKGGATGTGAGTLAGTWSRASPAAAVAVPSAGSSGKTGAAAIAASASSARFLASSIDFLI